MSAEVLLGGTRFLAMSHVYCLPSKGHDRALVTPSFAGVGDGATPLAANWPSPVTLVERGLAAMAAAAESELEVEEVWQRAIVAAADDFPADVRPSAAMIAVRGIGVDLEMSLLGDCVGMVKMRTRRDTVRLTDPTVSRRDALASQIEDPSDRQQVLIANRREMNDSYWIFADDVRAAGHTVTQKFRAEDVELVLIASDGLEPVLLTELGIVNTAEWLSASTPDEVRSTFWSLRSEADAGRLVAALDDVAWVLLVPTRESISQTHALWSEPSR